MLDREGGGDQRVHGMRRYLDQGPGRLDRGAGWRPGGRRVLTKDRGRSWRRQAPDHHRLRHHGRRRSAQLTGAVRMHGVFASSRAALLYLLAWLMLGLLLAAML